MIILLFLSIVSLIFGAISASWIIYTDYREKLISDDASYMFFASGVLWIILHSSNWSNNFAAAFLGGGIIFLMHFCGRNRQQIPMGDGDILICASWGIWLGLGGLAATFFILPVFSILLAIVRRSKEIPMAPPLFTAGLLIAIAKFFQYTPLVILENAITVVWWMILNQPALFFQSVGTSIKAAIGL